MKQIFTFTLLLFSTLLFAQTEQIFNNCGTDFLPENSNRYNSEFEDYYQNQISLKAKTPVSYYIPVVFHIINTGEPIGTGSNISDIEIYSALENLNNHFKNDHNHPNNSNSNIQFVLANKAPDGSCSTGINRVNFGNNSTYTQYGSQLSSTDNGVDATTIRTLSNWNPNHYYNIWVVNKITSSSNVAAYAYLSNSHGQPYDGTFIMARYVNSGSDEILTHEIGHSLNLEHTFQGSSGTNCPSQMNGCGNDGDCVSDTPPHIKNHVTDLILTAANQCSGNNNSTFKHNYMTYTKNEYQRVFTPLQITRMQSAINFYRSSYLPANNTIFKMNHAPIAQFIINNKSTSNKQFFCIGTPISLKNTSTCFLNTFNKTTVPNYSSLWTITKNGQTVLTSSEPNPNIVLNQIGTYNITLTAKNNIGSNSITKSNIIEIIDKNNINYCSSTTLNKGYFGLSIDKVKVHHINNSTTRYTNEGYIDFSCTHISQLSSTTPNKIDITVSNYNAGVTDNLIVQGYIDYNKNGVFESSELILDESVPPLTDHKEYSFHFSAPSNIKTNEVFRMRIVSERISISNNKLNCTSQYNIGDIEDYGVIFVPNLSIEAIEDLDYNIFPNPVTDILTIDSNNSKTKEIELFTISGQQIKSFTSNNKSIQIDVSQFQSGTYILKINNIPYKFIKK